MVEVYPFDTLLTCASVLLVVFFLLVAVGAAASPTRQDYRREIRRFGEEARDQIDQTSNEFRQEVKKTMQQHRK